MKQNERAWCTIGLIVVNILVLLLLSMRGPVEDTMFMLSQGAVYEPYIVQNHEYYRLFISLFLHFGMAHLLNNMVLLGALGVFLEAETGKVRFLIIYFMAGLGGNLLSLWWNMTIDRNVVSAGASGAVFGLMGGLLWVVIKNHGRVGRLTSRGVLFMVGFSLYFGLAKAGIDNMAHIGGLVIGFLTAFIIYRKPRASVRQGA